MSMDNECSARSSGSTKTVWETPFVNTENNRKSSSREQHKTQCNVKGDLIIPLTKECQSAVRGSVNTITSVNSHSSPLLMMLIGKWWNVLLLAAIPATLSKVLNWNYIWVFICNFVVLLPLASILGDLTEAVASHIGDTAGGLMNATFGNAVELIITIMAIRSGEIWVVQTSLMGSIYSNMLLVLGAANVMAGRKEGQKLSKFNPLGATVPAYMLFVSGFIVSMISIWKFMRLHDEDDGADAEVASRVGASMLLLTYFAYLIFSLKTHREFFCEEADTNDEKLSLISGICGLAVVTALVSVFAEFLIDSVTEFCEGTGLSQNFLGGIMLPIIGNAVEHWTAVQSAWKGKMDLAIAISLGSAAQISLFVLPVAVLVGWFLNEDVTLSYPLYEVVPFVFSIFIVSFLVQQGTANWMYGLLLLCIYSFVAFAYWYDNE